MYFESPERDIFPSFLHLVCRDAIFPDPLVPLPSPSLFLSSQLQLCLYNSQSYFAPLIARFALARLSIASKTNFRSFISSRNGSLYVCIFLFKLAFFFRSLPRGNPVVSRDTNAGNRSSRVTRKRNISDIRRHCSSGISLSYFSPSSSFSHLPSLSLSSKNSMCTYVSLSFCDTIAASRGSQTYL